MQKNQRPSAWSNEPSTLDLSRLLETIPAAAILVDERRRIVGANPRFCSGRRRDWQMVGSFCHAASHGRGLPCEVEPGGGCPCRECLSGSVPIQQVHVHTTADGEGEEEVWSSLIGGSTGGAWLVLQTFRAMEGPTAPPPGRLVGCSPAMLELLMRLVTLADGHDPVLVRGEPGTERELVARELYESGPCREGSFTILRAVSPMAGSPERLPPAAGHPKGATTPGTIFVDDVTLLSLERQRVLVAAMNLDEALREEPGLPDLGGARWIFGATLAPGAAFAAGQLLPELAERLQSSEVVVPPLRVRHGDLPALVEGLRPWLVAPPELQIDASVAAALAPLPLYGNLWELQRRLQDGALRAGSGPLRAEHLVWEPWASHPEGYGQAGAPGRPA